MIPVPTTPRPAPTEQDRRRALPAPHRAGWPLTGPSGRRLLQRCDLHAELLRSLPSGSCSLP
jgi:hypothetical protein